MIVIDICLNDIPAESRKKANNGKTYAKLIVDEMKKKDDYGNTHTVYMSQSKEQREAKTDKAYVGKGVEYAFDNKQSKNTGKQTTVNTQEEDGLPF